MKICQIPHVIWKVQVSFFQILYHSSVSPNITLLYFYSAQILYNLIKRSPLKCKFLRNLSDRVKSCQIVMSILKRKINSSSNFASFFIFMIHNSSVNFKLIHFVLWIKGSHQGPNFETFECSGKSLPNSSRHFPNHKSVFLQTLHHSSVSWNITLVYFCSSNIIYFVQKESIKVQIVETFECSGQNSSNSSCQLWKDKSIPFQILHHSSLSWHITLL